MAAKEKLSSDAYQVPRPIVWFMDVHLGNFLETLDPKSRIAQKVSLLILDYDKKCAQAQIDLIDGINDLMSKVKI